MRNEPLQIGVTGGIGAGKTVVCRIFKYLGVPVYNADERARYLMVNHQELKGMIIQSFGDESYLPDGSLNRGYLAARVFPDEQKVKQLNQLVHPQVGRDYQEWLNQLPENPYVIREAALMIESGSYRDLDYLITVTAPQELRIKRVLARDPQRNRQQVLDIMSNQISEEKRLEKSNFVLENDQQKMLIPQVLALHEKFNDLRGSRAK